MDDPGSPVEWRTYPNDPRYEVSPLGEVRRRGRLLPRKPSVTKTGYQTVVISAPQERPVGRYVHRMVMETFVGECPDGMEVSHLNGIPADNRLENLTYESRSANHARKIQHGTDFNGERNPAAKLSVGMVSEIRESSESESVLAERYGVTRATIGRVKRGESWRSVGPENWESVGGHIEEGFSNG